MINISNLSFSYDSQAIFDNASCTIPSNGVFVIKGDNGIGKSTLLKLIMGILKIDNGKIEVDNITLSNDSKESDFILVKDKVAYISQQNNLISFLNAKENGCLGNIIYEKRKKNLILLDNESYAFRKINELSNGEKLLISIQRALNENKHIFLLDECSDFLDSKNTSYLIKKLKKLGNNNLIIIVTHDQRIISEFENKIEIKNHKIFCNYNADYEKNENAYKVPMGRKHYFYLIKKLLKANIFNIFLMTIVTIVTTIIFSTFFSFLTYDFTSSFDATIGEGLYTFNYEEKSNLPIELDNIRYEYIKSIVPKEEGKLIESTFIPDGYYGNLGYVVNSDISIGKIKITDSAYKTYLERGMIEEDKIILNYGIDMAQVSIPYEIEYTNKNGAYDDKYLNLFNYYLNKNDLSIIKFDRGIKLYGALWNNYDCNYNTMSGVTKLFSSLGDITFLTPSIYNKLYNGNITFNVLDNEIYISSMNYDNYIEGKLEFFPYSNYNLGNYYPYFIDINNVFNNSYLIKDDSISNLLKGNQVLISEEKYNELISLLPLYSYPIIHIDDSNKTIAISFYKNNNLQLKSYSQINSSFSEKDYSNFKSKYSNSITYYSYYAGLLFLVEIGIIYIFTYSYRYINKNNIYSLSIYFSKFKTSFIFSVPLLISFIFSSILGLILSIFLIDYIYGIINLNILKFTPNVASVLLTIMINMIMYTFSFYTIYSKHI